MMKLKILFAILFTALPVLLFAQEMVIEYKTIKEETDNYEINVTYPQVKFPDALMGVRDIAEDINLSIDSMMTGQINAFKQEAAGNKPGAGEKNTYKVEGDVIFKDHGFLSVLFSNFTSMSGAAHPLTTMSSFNASAGSGKVNISDLFIKDSEWLRFISDYSIKELKDNAAKNGMNDDGTIEKGAAPDAANFTVFNVNKDMLYLTFNPYQVGPGVLGAPRVTILLGDMVNYIDHQGPLAFLYTSKN
jgi:hypothetical protein